MDIDQNRRRRLEAGTQPTRSRSCSRCYVEYLRPRLAQFINRRPAACCRLDAGRSNLRVADGGIASPPSRANLVPRWINWGVECHGHRLSKGAGWFPPGVLLFLLNDRAAAVREATAHGSAGFLGLDPARQPARVLSSTNQLWGTAPYASASMDFGPALGYVSRRGHRGRLGPARKNAWRRAVWGPACDAWGRRADLCADNYRRPRPAQHACQRRCG